MRGPESATFVEVGETFEVLDDAQAQVQAWRLGHDRDPSADLHAVRRRERDTRDRGRARGWCNEGAERPNGGRLPSAVGAEKTEYLTPTNIEGDIVECDAVAESLRQMSDR